MSPRYEKGDIVICSPARGWTSGDYCIVITQENEAMIKRVYERDGHYLLNSVAPGFEPFLLEKKHIRAIYKIVWKKEK